MDIIYRKDTLYVYIDEVVDEHVVRKLERNVENIMETYNINNLVVDTNNQSRIHFHGFESRYNSKHKPKMIIK